MSTDKIYWNTATLIHLHSTGCFCTRKAELNPCNREAAPKNLLSGPFLKKFADFARDVTGQLILWISGPLFFTCGHRRAKRSYSTFKVKRGGHEEIHLIQGKEQRLCFAIAATKRYPMSKVRETQVRQWVLREGIRGQTHWNYNHRKLVNLITGTTALSNSMKLSHALWGHPRQMGHGGEVWQTSSGPLEKGMANHFSILALRTPWTVWKGKMIAYWKRNSPGW